MRAPPRVRLLPDGRRLHLQDGPIDLVLQAFGPDEAVRGAYRAAARRFAGLLDELCGELGVLRRPPGGGSPQGGVAKAMERAVLPFAAETFITPMAAVAGAVADEVLAHMTAAAALARAFVNNGGDIALFVAPGEGLRVGLVDRPDRPSLFGRLSLAAQDRVGGVATSGWRGRSFSLGIADSVTVLAASAAEADAAATVIANAVDLPGHAAVRREPASSLQPDTDLGERLVTRAVGALTRREVARALDAGEACARRLLGRGSIAAAALRLGGETRVAGPLRLQPCVGEAIAPYRSRLLEMEHA